MLLSLMSSSVGSSTAPATAAITAILRAWRRLMTFNVVPHPGGLRRRPRRLSLGVTCQTVTQIVITVIVSRMSWTIVTALFMVRTPIRMAKVRESA